MLKVQTGKRVSFLFLSFTLLFSFSLLLLCFLHASGPRLDKCLFIFCHGVKGRDEKASTIEESLKADCTSVGNYVNVGPVVCAARFARL